MRKGLSLLSGPSKTLTRSGFVATPVMPHLRLTQSHSYGRFQVFRCSSISGTRTRKASSLFCFPSASGLFDTSKLLWGDSIVSRRYCAPVLIPRCWFGSKSVRSSKAAAIESDSLAYDDKTVTDVMKVNTGASEVKNRRKKIKNVKGKKSSSLTSQMGEIEELKGDGTAELSGAVISSNQLVSKQGNKISQKKKPRKKKDVLGTKSKAENVTKIEPIINGAMKSLYPPTGKSVMVVESLTKAKAIQDYLGDKYEVLPTYGHVRDLAARSGSVRPDDDFSMVWEIPSAAWTHLKSIKEALNGAENLILASDPDREGEAIAWHISEMLRQQDALHENLTVARVVFYQITEASVKNSLLNPRGIDSNLVYAYLARRALDYLIGFNISPLLWRKLPGCQSAGRVQSAALSLVCDKEAEIDVFKPQEYWSVEVQLCLKPSSMFYSQLSHFSAKKLAQLSITTMNEAMNIQDRIMNNDFFVAGSKTSIIQKKSPTPYITSTLQQDAASQLYFSPMTTMKVAQKLYEGVLLSDGKIKGLITYPRTDGLHISNDAVEEIRSLVADRYNNDFVAGGSPRSFKKVKNAQEAHEAIRPTDIRMMPSMLADALDENSIRLYTLIWCRTVACQMQPATVEQIQVDVGDSEKSIVLRSSCSKVVFRGYRAVYEDMETGHYLGVPAGDPMREEEFQVLKSLKIGDPLEVVKVEPKQHFTQAPARYSEGSLVKKLEELGIGRPSTYASILKVLKDRNYVKLKSRMLYPEFRGRMVTTFLSQHFSELTDYSFTADMETELDNICAGSTEWKGLLDDYWRRFKLHCNHAESVTIHQVEKLMENEFGDVLFRSLPDESRKCPSCMIGTLSFKVSRFGYGYFIGCNQHPSCKYIAKTLYGEEQDEDEDSRSNKAVEEPKLLGLHPISQEKILLKKGPYGCYVQLGEDRKGHVPKRISASHVKDVNSISLEDALNLLRYPLTLGNHPEDRLPIILKTGKTGFIIRHREKIASLPKNILPDDLTMEKALEILSGTSVRRCGRPKGKSKHESETV